VCWSARRLGIGDDVEAAERLDRVRPQRDAGADLAQLGRALDNQDVATGSLQRDGGCESSDSGADH
jgi:hypothetical protein